MASKRLTDTSIRQARPKEKEYQLHADDVPGLYLRVRPNGSKDWILRYTSNSLRRKFSLGSYPTVSLVAAKALANDERARLSQGVDPHAYRIQEEADRKASIALAEALPQTVSELFDLWERQELSKRIDAGAETRRKFAKDVFGRIGDLQLNLLRRGHITAILDDVAHRGAPRIAGMLLSDLRQMFSFAVIREYMPADPTVGLKKAAWGGRAAERDRVLSEDEIKTLAHAMPGTLTPESQHTIWIMLSTLCRVGEISQARWSDINENNSAWTIRADIAKNGVAHTINLSPFAIKHFDALYARCEARAKAKDEPLSEWVLPGRHHSGHVDPKSLAKQIADRQRGKEDSMSRRSPHTNALRLSGKKWTPHDLRRTGATYMGDLGVRVEVIEKCLNHTEQNRLIRTYQRQEQRPQMIDAWLMLGKHLEKITAKANPVAQFKRGGGRRPTGNT